MEKVESLKVVLVALTSRLSTVPIPCCASYFCRTAVALSYIPVHDGQR